MATRTVQVIVPEWVWGRLASIADRQHRRISDVIADQLLETITGDGDQLADLTKELKVARRSGWRAPHSDRQANERKSK